MPVIYLNTLLTKLFFSVDDNVLGRQRQYACFFKYKTFVLEFEQSACTLENTRAYSAVTDPARQSLVIWSLLIHSANYFVRQVIHFL